MSCPGLNIYQRIVIIQAFMLETCIWLTLVVELFQHFNMPLNCFQDLRSLSASEDLRDPPVLS